MRKNYGSTMRACFVGYIVQAICNNFAPLLFLTFQKSFQLPMTQITLLVTINFALQLTVDACSMSFVDRLGYRVSTILGLVFSAAGLLLLTCLPQAFANPFWGLLIAVAAYALGGGLLEVLISPIVEACPTDNKQKAMSLLHSFYCWGHVSVVLISTLFFALFGIENWRILAILWALVPIADALAFTRAPIAPLIADGARGMRLKELAGRRVFWLIMLAMLCAGASEQAVSQWASTFAERGLRLSKTLGDLAGPMFFALSMGVSRALYGKLGHRLPLQRSMALSAALCVAAYLLIAFSPWPVLGLLGCGICGFSVGLFWPGTLSMAAVELPRGGTAMYCLLALAGDLGCSAGPTLAGMVAGADGARLNLGILVAVIFPLTLLLTLLARSKRREIS